jgi:hypothetical protein
VGERSQRVIEERAVFRNEVVRVEGMGKGFGLGLGLGSRQIEPNYRVFQANVEGTREIGQC